MTNATLETGARRTGRVLVDLRADLRSL